MMVFQQVLKKEKIIDPFFNWGNDFGLIDGYYHVRKSAKDAWGARGAERTGVINVNLPIPAYNKGRLLIWLNGYSFECGIYI